MSEISIEAELAKGDAQVKEIASKAKSADQLISEAVAAPPEVPVEEPAADKEEEAQEAVAEAAEAEVEAPADEEEADKRFTLLAEREVKLRTLEKDVKEKEANLGKSVDQLRKEIYADIVRLLDDDPQGFFDEAGKKYEDISKKMLERRPDPTALKLKKELSTLQKKLQEQEEARLLAEQKRLHEDARAEVRAFVEKSDKHPLTRAAQMSDEVLNVIQIHYSETGQVLSEDAAADRIEAYLSDLVEKINTVKPPKAASVEAKPKKTVSPTLKNKQAASVPTRGNGADSELLSREESIARAAKLIKWIPRE